MNHIIMPNNSDEIRAEIKEIKQDIKEIKQWMHRRDGEIGGKKESNESLVKYATLAAIFFTCYIGYLTATK